MTKISGLPTDSTPVLTDYMAYVQAVGPTTSKMTLQSLITFINANGTPSAATQSNPYKFRCFMNAAAGTGNNAFATIPFDTKNFDTSNNVSTVGVFTAPITGFFTFHWNAVVTLSAGAAEQYVASLFKNGIEISRGSEVNALLVNGSHGSDIVQATAGDLFDVRTYAPTARSLTNNSAQTFFSGALHSLT